MSSAPAPKVALVTAREALAVDEDLPPLARALAALGAEVTMPIWDDAAVDWAQVRHRRAAFDLGLCRADRRVSRVGGALREADPARKPARDGALEHRQALSRRARARAGVPVVPTRFVAPGADAATELEHFIDGDEGALTLGDTRAFTHFVVKPVVGAGTRDVARHSPADAAAARAHLARLLGAGRHAMLQPYLDRVDQHGETAVIFFAGALSHSVRKGPLLKPGAGPVSSLVAPETITPQDSDQTERRVALAAVRAIPFEVPLYARVDLVPGEDDTPCVLELELTEPSIFCTHAPGSAHRLATAIIARIHD